MGRLQVRLQSWSLLLRWRLTSRAGVDGGDAGGGAAAAVGATSREPLKRDPLLTTQVKQKRWSRLRWSFPPPR